jgi:hypothetical protein
MLFVRRIEVKNPYYGTVLLCSQREQNSWNRVLTTAVKEVEWFYFENVAVLQYVGTTATNWRYYSRLDSRNFSRNKFRIFWVPFSRPKTWRINIEN